MDANSPTKAKALNPREREPTRYPADVPGRGENAGAKAVAEHGYAVLDRADVRSTYNQSRDGLSAPDSPHPRIYED